MPTATSYRHLWVATALLALGACGGDGGGSGNRPWIPPGGGGTAAGIPESLRITAVVGTVRDKDGDPVAGVSVKAGGAETTTGEAGTYRLDAAAGPGLVVRFDKAAFLPGIKRVDVQESTATALDVVLLMENTPATMSADLGGQAEGAGGALLVAPEGAFVNEAGETVTGAVKVYLTPLDPSKEQDLAAYPGDLRATTAAGEMVQLETFGVLDVTVRKDGEELQVKEGASLTIRIPAPSGISNPPESVALWSFDEATALWREEGTATWLSADRVYEGEISHLSPWNADVPLEATCIKGTMQDDAGNPIPGAYVTGLGVDYSGASSATTGADGTFCMAVRKSSTVKVTALHPAGGATMREVSSGPGDTPVPPDCASQSCLRVGIWEVERSVVKLPDGSAVSCDSLQNPFAGTCAAGLMDLATCFHPAGTCTMEGAVSGSMQAVWENGSRLVWTVSTDGTSTGDMYSPEGTPCGTFEIEVDTSTGTSKQVVRGASGQSWSLETSQSGLVTVICTNGQRLSFPKAQLEAFTACTGGGGTSNEACTWEGGGTPGTPSMGPCETDADCTSPGQVCCTRTSIRLCMSKIVCDSMCRTSSDCTGGMTCCNADSGAGFCAPPSSCTE